MKAQAKSLAKQVAKGDFEGLQEKAKDGLAKGSTALKQMRAERTDGLLDEMLKKRHDTLTTLHTCTNEVIASLKREAERAHKSSKSGMELHDAIVHSIECLPSIASQFHGHSTASTAVSNNWEVLAAELEMLVAKGKHELSQVFSEGQALYSHYLTTVNELAAKQGKDRKAKGAKEEEVHRQYLELQARKQAEEGKVSARLSELHRDAQGVLGYILDHHGVLQACFLCQSLETRRGSLGPEGSVTDWPSYKEGAEESWRQLMVGVSTGSFWWLPLGRTQWD